VREIRASIALQKKGPIDVILVLLDQMEPS
jgi:hypothetical protein